MMQVIWGSALRQRELLNGLVDLREPDLAAEQYNSQAVDKMTHGRKRSAEMDTFGVRLEADTFSDLQPASFHSRPMGRLSSLGPGEIEGRRGSASSTAHNRPVESPSLSLPVLGGSFVPPSSLQPPASLPAHREGMFSFSAEEMQHHTYDILRGDTHNSSPFTSRPGTSAGFTNYTDL